MVYPKTVSEMMDSLVSVFNTRNDIQIIRTLECKFDSDRLNRIFNQSEKDNMLK